MNQDTGASVTTAPAEIEDTEFLASIFEERAEFLSKQELTSWSTETPRDREVLEKLAGPGAKLLVGPRGSGKSTLLRKAYFSLVGSTVVLPAYVNFARSLALEPLFHRQANALQLFRQWVLFKIVDGLAKSFLEARQQPPADLATYAQTGTVLIENLERGNAPLSLADMLAPSQLLVLIEKW